VSNIIKHLSVRQNRTPADSLFASQMCHLAEVSIDSLLETSDNAETLLAVHAPGQGRRGHAHRRDKSPGANVTRAIQPLQ
jgi:hypothetical protein